MKKTLIILFTIVTFFLLNPNNILAQTQTDPGYWTCAWNDSIGACGDTMDGGLHCEPGFSPTGEIDFRSDDLPNLCAEKTTDPYQCTIPTPCLPYQDPGDVDNGITGYFIRDLQCIACGNIAREGVEICPTNITLYSNISMCGNAISELNPNSCEVVGLANGAVCKSSCGEKGEKIIPNTTCTDPGNVCCVSKDIPDYLCSLDGEPLDQIKTAIGCISFVDPEAIATFFIAWGVRIAGGIAMLVFLAAGFQMITSSGNPEKVQSAKDLFIAATTGVLMVIFCIFLLRFIGFNLLGIFR